MMEWYHEPDWFTEAMAEIREIAKDDPAEVTE